MPEIDGLFFEGDVTTAAMMRLESAQLLNKYLLTQTCSLNPLIIKSVSNIEAAAYQAIRSAYLNSGQETYAAKRLIIAADAEGDQILEAMTDMARSLRIAAYDASPEPFMSSMVSAYEAQTAMNIQTQLQKQGANTRLPMKLILGGTGLLSAGIVELPAKMQAQLTSGPLLQVIRAQSNEECIALANQNTSFTAGIITEDLNLMSRYAACCRAEQLYHNMPLQNPGRFQPIAYPNTQILTGILQFSQPLPGVKINSNQALPL
ncbi:MAG: astD [Gammaproteobacteria bacterium]|nr:astD [Gammaproteobacteria bacterium]